MTRYIDADALKNSIDEHVYLVHHGFNETEYGCTQYGIHQIIDDAPTIEAVPVIRCKDCKYNSNTEGNYVNCAIIPQMFGKTPDDNYCSWAERKQDEH